MAGDLEFSYRLPLTYVRITGTRQEITDGLTSKKAVDFRSVVTTETGPDLLSRCSVWLTPKAFAKQKTTWNLLADGRLSGADVATTIEPLAAWKAALSAGVAVMGAGAPLLAMGPPGWIGLGGAAVLAAAGTAAAVGGGASIGSAGGTIGNLLPFVPADTALSAPPADVNPTEWNVHPRYVEEHPAEAQLLAGYRAALTRARAAHMQAVRAAVEAPDSSTRYPWEQRSVALDLLLRSTCRGAALAEAAYATWKASKISTKVVEYDERLRIDDLPSKLELEEWVKDTSALATQWSKVAKGLRVAVSVELEPILGDDQRLPRLKFEPLATGDTVYFRQPRPAIIETWKLAPKDKNSCHMERMDVRRVFVAYPGNEASTPLCSNDRASSAVAVSFDESGALTKISTERTDPSLQRAQGISELIPALSAAASAGSDLRAAVSPPSLVERAAEAKAAQELGLVPPPEDPLKDLKDQLAEQELRARLKLAQQMASATSAPVLVTVHYPAG